MQMLVLTETRTMIEDTANGGVPTTTVYAFEAQPDLKQLTFEFNNRTITYRRIDAPSDNEYGVSDVPATDFASLVGMDLAVPSGDTDSPIRKEKGYYLL